MLNDLADSLGDLLPNQLLDLGRVWLAELLRASELLKRLLRAHQHLINFCFFHFHLWRLKPLLLWGLSSIQVMRLLRIVS